MDASVSQHASMVVMAVVCVLVVAVTVAVFTLIKGIAKRNSAFLARSSLVSQPMPLGVQVSAHFQPQPGRPHAVWLDIDLSSANDPMGFELVLAVRLGPAAGPHRSAPMQTVIEGAYPVTFDDENDVRGLPNPPGTSALNTISSSTLGHRSVKTILRAFRFDVPPMPMVGEVHARIVPFAGTAFIRSHLALTVGDAPI